MCPYPPSMPRAHRLRVEGGVFHLTHRCHNRAFLLRFARDREDYRARMRAKLREFDVFLLDYCLTCNHAPQTLVRATPGYLRSQGVAAEGLQARGVGIEAKLTVAERHLTVRIVPFEVVPRDERVAVDACRVGG
jgi:hypothetical protein